MDSLDAKIYLLGKFPIKELSNWLESTTYIECIRIRKSIYENCAYVSSLKNGTYGYLEVEMSPVTYDTRAGGTPYQAISQDPGLCNLNIDDDTANARRVKMEARHTELWDEYLTSQAI